jgi:putative two-component system response regulator
MTDCILVVDDNEENLTLLRALLADCGYSDVITTTDPFQAIELFVERRPDLVLCDLHMPRMNGASLADTLRHKAGGAAIPIVILTGDGSRESRQKALRAGATDFLTKPFDHVEVALRVRNLLDLRHLHSRLEERNRTLDDEVRARTDDLDAARQETLERLAIAAEYRDDDTGQHAQRVGELSASIAHEMGVFAKEHVELIRRAAPLHDLGKIGIPDRILLKPGPLTDEEFDVMKRHTVIGVSVLSGSRSRVLRVAETIAGTHHERWDGGGYSGLIREETPLEGRIVAVADAYDAITNDRPYRRGRSHSEAIDEIRSSAGSHFDPHVVQHFLSYCDRTSFAGHLSP